MAPPLTAQRSPPSVLDGAAALLIPGPNAETLAPHQLEARAPLADEAAVHGGRAGNPDALRDGAVDAEASSSAGDGGLGGLAGAEVPAGQVEEAGGAGEELFRADAGVWRREGGVVSWCR